MAKSRTLKPTPKPKADVTSVYDNDDEAIQALEEIGDNLSNIDLSEKEADIETIRSAIRDLGDVLTYLNADDDNTSDVAE